MGETLDFLRPRQTTTSQRGCRALFRTNLEVSVLKLCVFGGALALLGQNAYAQQSIGAGGQIQQIPQPPALQKAIPDLPARRDDAQLPPIPDGPKFQVRTLHVTGETRFSEAELIAITEFKSGGNWSLAELRGLARKITNLYNRSGYFVAQAYLPPQDIKDGIVTIAVIEGRYGEIRLHNQSKASDGTINSVIDGLNSGDPVVTAPLERRLLIISDIPGVAVRSTLSPGATVGTSDLTIGVLPGERVSGSIQADNAGNPYTGVYRFGANVNFNEPLGIGDVLSARVLTSTTGGLVYGRLSYQAQVEDATLGAAYTAFEYKLGRQFSSLDARGAEQITSLYGSYPLLRSYNANLYGLLDVDYRTFQDKLGTPASISDKQAWVVMPGISGDFHDRFGGGGSSTFSLIASVGSLDIQSPLMQVADATTARTNGSYAKLAFSASRLQNISGPLSLYGSARGQVAFKNLDVSEKMELGGAYGVRAYPEGEAYGDEGYLGTLEARLRLPRWIESLPGEMQFITFVDAGWVRLNKNPWYTGSNSAARSGAGVGLTWAEVNNFSASVTYAGQLGNTAATSASDGAGGFWVQLVKYF